MIRLTVLLVLPFCLLLGSCGPSYIFDQEVKISETGWTYNDSLQFEVQIEDTLRLYNLYLDLEHSTDYPNQNLYLMLHTEFPNGQREGKAVSVDMANKMGRWNGKCSSGECLLRVFLQEEAFFNTTGTYKFTVAQHMRIEPLPAIQSVGFRVEDSGKNKK